MEGKEEHLDKVYDGLHMYEKDEKEGAINFWKKIGELRKMKE